MSNNTVTCIAVLSAKTGQEQTLKNKLDDLVIQTRKEPGCISYEAFVSNESSKRFLVHEVYKDKSAFDHHSSSRYLRELKSKLSEYAEEVDIRSY